MATVTFGNELCKALGLEDNDVFSITITSEVGNVDTVHIGQYANGDTYSDIGKVFKNYKIVPIDTE